jgi:hypothetical protein
MSAPRTARTNLRAACAGGHATCHAEDGPDRPVGTPRRGVGACGNSGPGKGEAPSHDLFGAELHRTESRVKRGVGLTTGRGLRDRLHQVPFAAWEGPRGADLLLRRAGAYARTAPSVLWTMTSPSVTFGGFGRIRSSFSSRTHSDATRVDSLA